jgi:hypothetical protein
MEICIQEGSSGQVVALDPEGAIPPRLVNSSIEAFGGFLSLYVEYGRRCQRCTGEEADAIAQDYDRLMRKIDPAAFAPLDSWWGLVTEQMKDGLL